MSPLLLVAGFLGAGKTTFLRQLLPALAAGGVRPRVVLNDFQNARVDGATLADIAPELVAIDGDCVCCATFEELLGALAATPAAPGQVVVVETNGTTDTGVLLELLGGEPRLDHLSPPLQLTVVDAHRFGRRDWQNTIEDEQIATATHLYVSRRDVVDDARWLEVGRALAQVVPAARATEPAALAEELVALERSLRSSGGRSASGLAAAPGQPRPGHDHGRHHFASLQVPLAGRVDESDFLEFLRQLPADVLRAKGIVELRQPPGERRSFQKVEAHVEISPCQLAEPETLAPVAVFVGPRLPADDIRSALARLLEAGRDLSAG